MLIAVQAELDYSVLEKLAYTAAGEVSPMAALFGGIVGQEVIKAVSAKFHPLYQFFYFDSIESLPDEPLPEEEFAPEVESLCVFSQLESMKHEGYCSQTA